MPVIDSHCHAGLDRYEPVESLLHHLRAGGVGQAILVQHGGQTDNSYLAGCLRDHPGLFGAVMLVEKDDDGSHIRMWAEQGIRGIRLTADSRAAGTDPFCHWRTAAELDLAVSTSSTAAILTPAFREVLEMFPKLNVVLEHLGGAKLRPPTTLEEFKKVMQLAAHPNLHIKVHGFGEVAALPYPFRSVPPFVNLALEAFGPRRMMWGSDYPLVSGREGYRHALEFPREYLAKRVSATELDAIFHGTAARLWKL